MHGISHHSFNSREEDLSINRIGNLPLIRFWKQRVEKTYNTYRNYSEKRIIIQCFLFSLPLPFIYFDLMDWIRWFNGQKFYIHHFDPNHSIYAVFFAPIFETFIFFLIPLEIFRLISTPRWLSYALIIFFFEGVHDQRSFFEHPVMWMTGYMFIVAYEAGRTRSLLHAILFCIIVHEAYNLFVSVINPALYPTPF